MIRMLLRMSVRGPDVERVTRALRAIMLPARIERACLRCELSADVESRGTLLYLEDWASEAEMERQIRSDRFVQMLLLMEMAQSPPDLQFSFVSETRGLDYVEATKQQGNAR
jgi:quinol monooxygenase YgiN